MCNIVVLIPSLCPDERLTTLVKSLFSLDFEHIIIIDDGSGDSYENIFRELYRLGCVVETHEKNLGKGAALKTGIRKAIELFGEGNAYITADGDGQHLPGDIRKVADALEKNPDSLILGTRRFDTPCVPWKSRLGNRFTSLFFRLTCGFSCADTQTGLRGIPNSLEKFALEVEGERYEYEMNFLSDAAGNVEFIPVPIETVYEDGNRKSHFRPIVDSARVYGRFLRFAGASLVGALADLSLFYLLFHMIPLPRTGAVFIATALARICSGIINFLLNRYWSFNSRKPVGGQAVRYGILFLCQMAASAVLVSLLSWAFLPEMAAKVIVDICLFFASYIIQKNWVFGKGR